MRFNDDDNAKLLLDTIPRVMHSIREEMRGVARGKFTVPQFRILNQLRKRPLTNSELAEWMGVTAPTMSRMLEPLEEKGLIVRTYNPNDRRSQSLSLTATGKREAEKIRRQALESFAARTEKLSSEESHTLASGLKVLAKMFDDDANDAPAERTKSSMKTKSVTLMMLVALASSISSCMGDRTTEDYANEQSRKEQAKLQEIAGTYRGNLVSNETGQSLGTLTLQLDSYTDVQNSSDGLTKIQVPVAKGTLFYSGINRSQINFDKYYYDSNSKLLQIQVPIVDASKTTQILSLRGTFSGDQLTGDIEALGGYSSSFTLVKNGPLVQAQNLNAIRGATAIAAGDETFVGTDNTSYKLTIQYPGDNTQQLFMNLFLPQRTVTATLIIGRTKLAFTSAILDERYNTLKGDAVFNTYPIELRCTRTGHGTPAEKWDCQTMAGDAVNHIVFGLANSLQAK
ncbi:MAG: MarR family winged helix-turn-helix transcriptional regulator [Bdellovibrionia bacterium]